MWQLTQLGGRTHGPGHGPPIQHSLSGPRVRVPGPRTLSGTLSACVACVQELLEAEAHSALPGGAVVLVGTGGGAVGVY